MSGPVLLTSAEMRRADRRAIDAGTPGIELMRRAGAAVATAAEAMVPAGARVLVLCGTGNNGGDGFVAASRLQAHGYAARVCCENTARLSGDAAQARQAWDGPVHDLETHHLAESDIVIDGLFGTGLSRDLDGGQKALVEAVNGCGRPILAIDIPSGIDADSGQVRGAAVQATRTVTFGCLKPGLLLQPGRSYAGDVEVADIGLAAEIRASSTKLWANAPDLWAERLPCPSALGHKYDRGHALVVSGGPAQTGAARLAARGALRAGAGLVSVVTTARALGVVGAHLTAIMLKVADDPDGFSDLLADERYNALVLGPGLGVGEATRRWVQAALEADRATVLDADGLTSFAGEPAALAALAGEPRENGVVLTPHDGEFKRLFDDEPFATAPSKVERTRGAAGLIGAVVVLKGPDTVIAAPDGRAAINRNGSPWLATAGSGDVLAGMTAGLMAQGMPAFEAACAAVWMHGDAAERFGPGLVSEDLPEMLPPVWRELCRDDRRDRSGGLRNPRGPTP